MIAEVPAWVLLPILGALIRLVCVAPTVRATWRGEDSPSLVSWSVWTTTTGLGAATGVAAGEPVAAAVPAAAFIQCSAMFTATLVSWWRYPNKRTPAKRLDWTCLALCGCTGTVWAVALLLDHDDPATATLAATIVLCAAVATDGIASGPTWRLAAHGEEPWLLWAGAATTPALVLLVLSGGTVATWAYPGYELALTAGIAALTVWRSRRGVAVVTAAAAVGVGAVVVAGQLGRPSIDPGPLWTTVLAAAAAVAVAAVIVPRTWAVAHRRAGARPAPWAAAAAVAVVALVIQIRGGGLALTVQAAILAAVLVQMAVVAAVASWTGARRPAADRGR